MGDRLGQSVPREYLPNLSSGHLPLVESSRSLLDPAMKWQRQQQHNTTANNNSNISDTFIMHEINSAKINIMLTSADCPE